jgi:hypothetical protein
MRAVMKSIGWLGGLASLVVLSVSAAAAGVDFFLYHAATDTVLGPYEFTSGARLGKTATSWKLAVTNETLFTLTDNSGSVHGPFTFAEDAPLQIGGALFTISTNAEAMLQRRADQRLWNSNPETNPKVLAVLRGEPADGYKFLRAEPDSVFVSNSKGIFRISLAVLPEDIRQKYGYDTAKADAFSKQQAAARAEADRKKVEEALAKGQALDQIWSSVTPVPVVQPDFPPPYFQTQGLGTSTRSGGVHPASNQRNGNNNNSSQKRITIGGP